VPHDTIEQNLPNLLVASHIHPHPSMRQFRQTQRIKKRRLAVKFDIQSYSRLIVVFILSVPATQAFPAALNCGLAATRTDTAICANETLHQRDIKLSSVYAKLIGAPSQQRGSLRQAQMDWLKTRNQCGADESCIMERYDERIGMLRTQLRDVIAYKPDSVDRQALEDLRRAVETMRKIEPEMPFEKVIDRLRIKAGMTSFSNVIDDNQPGSVAQFPTLKPVGVTSDEWRALLASKIETESENGNASYILMDIDGDGQRDLVVDSYVGGTGLFSYTSVLHREDGKFEGSYAATLASANAQVEDSNGLDDDADRSYLYSINGRGANQGTDWIRVRGRVYVAYRTSYYGEDNVYLLRPLTIVGDVPKLTIQYRYRLSVPKMQKDDSKGSVKTLDNALHAGLTRALGRLSSKRTRDIGNQDKPLCPILGDVKDDDRSAYFGYGPGHYSYEIVGNVPVWVGRQCYVGQVVDWFGGYAPKDGLYAQFWIRKPNRDAEDQTYSIRGVRTATGIKTSIAKVEGDNGG
jgi:uncharacterized protein